MDVQLRRPRRQRRRSSKDGSGHCHPPLLPAAAGARLLLHLRIFPEQQVWHGAKDGARIASHLHNFGSSCSKNTTCCSPSAPPASAGRLIAFPATCRAGTRASRNVPQQVSNQEHTALEALEVLAMQCQNRHACPRKIRQLLPPPARRLRLFLWSLAFKTNNTRASFSAAQKAS